MGTWEIVATILGVVTIVTGGVVKIFTHNASLKKLPPGESSAKLPAKDHRDIERMARLEEQVKGHGRELGEIKGNISKLSDKVTKLGDLLIEWVQSGRRR